jgi:ornithine cyclodeaminase/alanine dehydrogenase-like protein (mu-crystallin family)
MNSIGEPTGFINAEELTAFRTALASSLLMIRRAKLSTITVFGAGKQAYWHIRLALLLRGSSIKHVNIINRTISKNAIALMKSIHGIDDERRDSEGWTKTTFSMLSPEYGEYSRLIKEHVRESDAIFCTTPATEPLFDPTFLTAHEGRKKGRLVIAIGSYQPHMIEVDPSILRQAVKPSHGHHHHKHAQEGGCVVVDVLHGSLKEAGEIIQAGLTADQLVELGELVMLEGTGRHLKHNDSVDSEDSLTSSGTTSAMSSLSLDKSREGSIGSVSTTGSSESGSKHSFKSFFHGNGSGDHGTKEKKNKKEKEDGFCKWMSSGNVIYKSVGMGLMDLVVGGDIVDIARDRNIGTTIPSF